MKVSNIYLQKAKDTKNDEFYTTYETIESEVSNYIQHFINQTVLCNCDDPFESNFCKYFLKNFNNLKLKRLICTSYYSSTVIATETNFVDDNNCTVKQGNGYVLDISYVPNNKDNIAMDDIIKKYGMVKKLKGNGDFRSPECVKFLLEADIVVTNPPFSLFKEMVSLLVKYNKKYLLIGNQNAITYKEIFPLIQQNKAWIGYHFGDMSFRVPKDTEPRKTRFWVDETGQKWRSIGNAMWLTNLDNDRRHKKLILTKQYSPELYPKYDNFDAINVKYVADIPKDYPGIMGVPITFLNKYNPDQFEIIGEANHGSDNEYDLFKPIINGKEIFKKILIRNKHPEGQKIKVFKILDLFCGAGGFSYGMEKNSHFKTEIAVDIDKNAINTFKYNMPDTETIIGDITDANVKQKIITTCMKKGINMIIGGPPCQGFSLKGKKLGLDDPRNYLFNEYLKIVEAVNPEVFVIENVKALLSTSAGWFKNQILERVKNMGYHCDYGVLNASDFGVPQSRQRAIFICSKNKKVTLPIQNNTKIFTVRDAIYDLAYLNSNEGKFESEFITEPTSDYQIEMRKGSIKLYNHKASNHADIAIKKLQMIPPECGKEHLPNDLIGKQRFSGTWGRLKWDTVSPTIDTRFDAASNGRNNHPFLDRAITPREAARLQSFDDRFVFLGPKVSIRQQIGNAVPPLLAKAIADKIYKELGE
jgi:DNA-cytosine methyltransferase